MFCYGFTFLSIGRKGDGHVRVDRRLTVDKRRGASESSCLYALLLYSSKLKGVGIYVPEVRGR